MNVRTTAKFPPAIELNFYFDIRIRIDSFNDFVGPMATSRRKKPVLQI